MRAITRVLEAVPAGSTWIQLREKDLDARALLLLAHSLSGITHDFGAKLLINDRLDVALASGADGVQLAREGFDVAAIRAAWPGALVGVSCHSPIEALQARHDRADFAVLGPLFDTPSKLALGMGPQGAELIANTCARTGAFPLFGIGGIDASTAHRVVAAGATGVAVIRSVLADIDPGAAALALLDATTTADGVPPTARNHLLSKGLAPT